MTEDARPATPKPLYRGYKWELLALLCLAFFFHQGDRAIYGVVLPQIRADLNLTNSQLGFVGGVLFFTLAVLMPIAGYLGDMLRKKSSDHRGPALLEHLDAVHGAQPGRGQPDHASQRGHGRRRIVLRPAAYALLAKFHRATRALAMSVHQAAMYFGIMVQRIPGRLRRRTLGMAVGVLRLWRRGHRCSASSSSSGSRTAARQGQADAPGRMAKSRSPCWESFFANRRRVLLTAGFTAIVFVNNAYLVWAPDFLGEKFHLSLAEAGGYSMFYHHVTALVGVLVGGAFSDAWVRRFAGARMTMQTVSMLLGAPAILAMALAHSPVAAYVWMAVFGLFRGFYESNTHASLFDVIEPEYRGSAVGAMVMVAFMIGSVAPWLMGYLRGVLAPGMGLSYAFAGYSSCYVIGGVAVSSA